MAKQSEKTKRGRPTKYLKEYCEQAYKLCLLGATDAQLGDFFEVSEQTINTWKKKHPEFLESMKRGKDVADAEMAHSLFHRGIGYSHEAVKIITVSDGNNMGSHVEKVPYVEHYPPDTAAAFIWLKNRRPDLWRDKQEIEHGVDDDLATLIREVQSGRNSGRLIPGQFDLASRLS